MYKVNKRRLAIFIIMLLIFIFAGIVGIRYIFIHMFNNNSKQNNKNIKKIEYSKVDNSEDVRKERVGLRKAREALRIEQSKGLKIVVSIKKQNVIVYNNGLAIKTMVCSTGIDSEPTPKGDYETDGKGDSFYSPNYGQGGYYWIRFIGEYLFHSVPFDEDETIIEEEEEKLGQKASHGCVRLSLKDSKWLYDNVPEKGTPVTIE